MRPQPLYLAHNLRPAYCLRYGWTGWPSSTSLPSSPPAGVLDSLKLRWEEDGLRLLEHRWEEGEIQLTFSSSPRVSPLLMASRAKGRLQHALAQAGAGVRFARSLAVRSIGDNTHAEVDGYVRGQAARSELADARFVQVLEECRLGDGDIDLGAPVATGSGRYWYLLHLVLTVAEHARIGDPNTLTALREMASKVGAAKAIGIVRFSPMPDHLHALLRPPPEMSPEEVALAFQNNLAWAAGRCRIWEDSYYVGTCGAYTMAAVRWRNAKRTEEGTR